SRAGQGRAREEKTVEPGAEDRRARPEQGNCEEGHGREDAREVGGQVRGQEGARQEGAGQEVRRAQAPLMKLVVVAVGQRVPDWAQAAWDDYAKRFPPELGIELRAVKAEARAS